MFCKKCGTKIEADWKICAKCGAPINSDTPTDTNPLNNTNSMEENIAGSVNNATGASDGIQTYKISAGQLTLNGEHQLVSLFEVCKDGITWTFYNRTTQCPPKSSMKFNPLDVVDVTYKSTIYKTFKYKFNLGLSIILLVSTLIVPLSFWLGVVGLVYCYLAFRIKTVIIKLRQGQQLKIYYSDKQEAEEVINKILEV